MLQPDLTLGKARAMIGTTIRHYQIIEKLGAGGIGVVYKAQDVALRRSVALKFLSPEVAGDDERRARFQREARVAAALNHPNICTVYEVGEVEAADQSAGADGPNVPVGTPFIAMEYLDGEMLATRLDRVGRLPVRDALDIAGQVASGLADAHANRIVHRDLKPQNVMLTAAGRVKVLDFGLAKPFNAIGGAGSVITTAQMISAELGDGAIVGTVAYMSPEQALGQPVDARSDVFAFGIMLYELLTGRRPFRGDTATAILAKILESDPDPLTSTAADVPPDLTRIVRRCLQKKPEDRYGDTRDLVADLDRVQRRLSSRWSLPMVAVAPMAYAVVAAIVIAVAVSVFVFLKTTRPAQQATDSVMVLPFTNVQNDANLEYLADGLSESLTNTLSRVSTVRVIARATAYAYKGRDKDLRTLGREMNVRLIVTGRVSGAADHFRVQADIVDATAGTQLWGKQYEGTARDSLRIQEDVARNVGQNLRLGRSVATQQALTRAPTVTPEAYDLYLRGKYALSRGNVGDVQKGIELFQRTLELAPTYALAYAGLADSYLVLSGAYLVPKEASIKARAAASRAIELDPDLPEPHVSMGVVETFYDYAWLDAEKQFQRAIDLNPFDASFRLWYGWNLFYQGKSQAGLDQVRRAHELDPLSPFIETGLGQMYYLTGQTKAAIQQLRSVIASNPKFANGHHYLGVAQLYTGDYAEAIRQFEEALRLDPEMLQPVQYLVYAHAKAADLRSARARLAELQKLRESRYVGPYTFATVFAALGEREKSMEALQQAYDERDDALTSLKHDLLLDAVRGDPRVAALLHRMGLD